VVPAVLGPSLRRAAARHRHAAGERPLADRRDPARARHAIYLAEYAKPTTGRIVKPVVELLAGVPTIVFGYFALTFFTPVVYDDLLGMDVRTFNALSAGISETMIVLVAAGQRPNLTADPRQSVETITTFIAATTKGDMPTCEHGARSPPSSR
jgi:ABC-type phosphate transport system permease subunit